MRTVLLYTSMVFLPVLGVLGIIRLGSHIQAPISIAGSWELQIPANSCAPFFPGEAGMIWIIQQSGPDLHITIRELPSIKFTGRLDGQALSASTAPSELVGSIQFTASVDRQVDPDSLSGEIRSSACPTPVAIQGVRLPADAYPVKGN